jgi:hypothetical protein
MRLLGLALFTLLVMGLIQISLWKSGDVASVAPAQGVRIDRTLHDLGSELPPGARTAQAQDRKYNFVVRERDTWSALVGSPGYHKARFNLPRDVRVESGVLLLDLDANLQKEGIARLRVAINGERRAEVILPEGDTTHTIRLNLLPTDLTHSVLEVSLSAQGRFPETSCEQDWTGGMIVRVEPSSRVELTTTEPLTTLEDRLRATGDPVQIVWPEGGASMEMARLLRFAVDQNARGARSQFVPADQTQRLAVAMDSADIDTAEAMLVPVAQEAAEWPMAVAASEQIGAARFFEFSTDWTIPYDLRSTPRAELPTHFDLDMSLVGLHAAETWMLSVMLNDRALHTERLENNVTSVRRSVPLPPEGQGFANKVQVRLINSEPQSGQNCISGVPVMAQLERGTRLRGGVVSPDSLHTAFLAALPKTLDLQVSGALNAAEATTAVQFMTDAFGPDMQWTPRGDAVRSDTAGSVRLMWRADVAAAATDLLAVPDRDVWLVWPHLAGRLEAPYGLMRVTDADQMSAWPLQEGARIAALVSLPARNAVAAVAALDGGDIAAALHSAADVVARASDAPTQPVSVPYAIQDTQLAPLPADRGAALPAVTGADLGQALIAPELGQTPIVIPARADPAPAAAQIPAAPARPATAQAAPDVPLAAADIPRAPRSAVDPAATRPQRMARAAPQDRSSRPLRRPAEAHPPQTSAPRTVARVAPDAPVAAVKGRLYNPLALDAASIVTLSFQRQY